jgi:PST family polysaccharide transporter
LLQRAQMFRALAIDDVAATQLSTGVAIAMASSGFGYWALVTRPVALYSLVAIGVWLYCRWLPVRPTLTPAVKDMVTFGLNLIGFSLTDYSGRNVDRIAVGRTLGAQTLGYYQNSLLFYDHLLSVLVMPLHPVAVAGLSKLQHDLVHLKRSWAKALATVAFYAMPAFGLLATVSADAIVVLLGPTWATSGVLLSILALRGIPHAAERTSGWLHVAAGRTDRWLRAGVATACGQVLALLLGLPFGMTGVVCAYVLFMYVAFVPTLAYAGRPLGIGARDVIGAVGAQLAGALVAAGLGFILRLSLLANVMSLERIAILVAVYVLTYLVVVIGLFKVTAPLQVCLSVVSDFLPRPLKPVADQGAAQPRK